MNTLKRIAVDTLGTIAFIAALWLLGHRVDNHRTIFAALLTERGLCRRAAPGTANADRRRVSACAVHDRRRWRRDATLHAHGLPLRHVPTGRWPGAVTGRARQCLLLVWCRFGAVHGVSSAGGDDRTRNVAARAVVRRGSGLPLAVAGAWASDIHGVRRLQRSNSGDDLLHAHPDADAWLRELRASVGGPGTLALMGMVALGVARRMRGRA